MRLMRSSGFFFISTIRCGDGGHKKEIFMRFFTNKKSSNDVSLEKSFSLIKCQMNYNIEESEKRFFAAASRRVPLQSSLLSALTFN